MPDESRHQANRIQGPESRRKGLGGAGEHGTIELDELHRSHQAIERLAELSDLLVGTPLRETQPVDGPETLDLHFDAAYSGLNGIPLPKSAAFSQDQPQKNEESR